MNLLLDYKHLQDENDKTFIFAENFNLQRLFIDLFFRFWNRRVMEYERLKLSDIFRI